MNKKASATASASSKSLRSKQEARLNAVYAALTKFFLGSATTTEKFWKTNNPSLREKSPADLVKAGKLKAVEQYVDYLTQHARSARPKFVDLPTDESLRIHEGDKEEVDQSLKEIPASHRVIVIRFENAESYFTYAPVVRRIVNQLPAIAQRLLRRDEHLCARVLFAFTADLPVTFPKLKVLTHAKQREAAQKLAAMGGTVPALGEIPRRRAPRQ
jgi:hypothetical protein